MTLKLMAYRVKTVHRPNIITFGCMCGFQIHGFIITCIINFSHKYINKKEFVGQLNAYLK